MACSLLFPSKRCVSVCLADTRRVVVRIGGAAERRIAEAIAAAPKRRFLTLRQRFEAALQHKGCHIPATVLIVFCCSRSGPTEEGCAGDCCGTQAQKLTHICSLILCQKSDVVAPDATRELWLQQIPKTCMALETLSTKTQEIGHRARRCISQLVKLGDCGG